MVSGVSNGAAEGGSEDAIRGKPLEAKGLQGLRGFLGRRFA
jgi:hypothetical protein